MWDLRYATAPMRTLERHKRGVLCLEWCPQDCDLLLSAAKDNHVYCWNPNSDVPGGEVHYNVLSLYHNILIRLYTSYRLLHNGSLSVTGVLVILLLSVLHHLMDISVYTHYWEVELMMGGVKSLRIQ